MVHKAVTGLGSRQLTLLSANVWVRTQTCTCPNCWRQFKTGNDGKHASRRASKELLLFLLNYNLIVNLYFFFKCIMLTCTLPNSLLVACLVLNVRLPPSSTEYGTVLELRINSGGKLPNFGFVVFDDSEPVQKILSNRVTQLHSFYCRDCWCFSRFSLGRCAVHLLRDQFAYLKYPEEMAVGNYCSHSVPLLVF